MNRKAILVSLLLPLLACGGGEKDGDVQHFDNCDVYPIYNVSGPGDPAWSPDMSSIVFAYQTDLWSISPEGGEPSQVTSMSGTELYPNWSPVAGANRLVFINSVGSEYTIYTLAPGEEPQEVKSFTVQIAWTSWSNDGQNIIFTQVGRKAIYRIPATGGEMVAITNNEGWGTVEVAQASPSRNFVLYIDQKDSAVRIREVSLDSGDPRTIISFSGTAEHPFALAESYDGTMVAYTTPYQASWSENLFLVPVAGGKTIAVTDFYYAEPNHPSWAADGKKLAIQMSTGIYMVELKL